MIVIVDYDMGNLHSIGKALEYMGGMVVVSRDPHDLVRAEKIVLPGIGAFPDGIRHLHDYQMYQTLVAEVVERKKPLLGICLGMQLLANTSEEFGHWEGLGFIPGDVRQFDVDRRCGLRVPQVGWNDVAIRRSHPVLRGIPDHADFYFVHSYHFVCREEHDLIATADYGGPFTAIVARENIIATQFHPEKSQRQGLQLLKNFVAWDGHYAQE